MKKITLVLLTMAMALSGAKLCAQDKYGPNAEECKIYLSYYEEYYKQKNYDDAFPNWRKAYSICPPTASENMLIRGGTLLSREIGKTKDAARRNALIDSLLTLQDVRAETYPKNAVKTLNNKAKYIAQYKLSDNQAVYDQMTKIIEANGVYTNFTSYIPYFLSAVELHKAGSKNVEEVIDVYEKSAENLDKAASLSDEDLKLYGLEKADIAKAREGLDLSYIDSKVASCDNLLALFTPRYEANPDDMALNAKIVGMLNTVEGCQNNSLYIKAATALYNNEPSARTAYSLYLLNKARGEKDLALKFIEEAASFSGLAPADAAKYSIEAAGALNNAGNNGKAADYARKAAELDPAYQGQAYYMIGNMWASSNCGGNEVTSRAKYWVAVDFMQKAKSADPSLAEQCNAAIGRYSSAFPNKADAFMYDIVDGQSYTANCSGMYATTTVRTRN